MYSVCHKSRNIKFLGPYVGIVNVNHKNENFC